MALSTQNHFISAPLLMSKFRVTDVVQSTPVHWHCDIMQSTRCDSGCQQCVYSEEGACVCHVIQCVYGMSVHAGVYKMCMR